MRRLLVVDDEILAVEGIKAALDWSELGISEVLVAPNARRARNVFSEREIDILLCDIEMPEESGLALVEWVGESSPGTQCIILTCHADFAYAREAMRLGTLDYLLKPVPAAELGVVIARAVQRLDARGNERLPERREDTSVCAKAASGSPSAERRVELPDMGLWLTLLRGGGAARVRHEVEKYLSGLPANVRADRGFLLRFLQDFQQIVYSVLRSRGIPAHDILDTPQARRLLKEATDTSFHLVSWVDFATSKVCGRFEEAEASTTPFGRAVSCIRKHLTEDMSCEQIATSLSLNPDYLSRLFKKQAGLSISEYIIRERMNLARELLLSTTMSVGEIASQVGYANFSNFSYMFKKTYNISPARFRQAEYRAAIDGPGLTGGDTQPHTL